MHLWLKDAGSSSNPTSGKAPKERKQNSQADICTPHAQHDSEKMTQCPLMDEPVPKCGPSIRWNIVQT